MQETKLTVRVRRALLENAKRYASRNHTTLTDLIEAYLQRLPVDDSLENAPIVRSLSGSLSEKASITEYRQHLQDKYEQ